MDPCSLERSSLIPLPEPQRGSRAEKTPNCHTTKPQPIRTSRADPVPPLERTSGLLPNFVDHPAKPVPCHLPEEGDVLRADTPMPLLAECDLPYGHVRDAELLGHLDIGALVLGDGRPE